MSAIRRDGPGSSQGDLGVTAYCGRRLIRRNIGDLVGVLFIRHQSVGRDRRSMRLLGGDQTLRLLGRGDGRRRVMILNGRYSDQAEDRNQQRKRCEGEEFPHQKVLLSRSC